MAKGKGGKKGGQKGNEVKKGRKKMPFKLRIRCNTRAQSETSNSSNKPTSNSKTTNWRQKMKKDNPDKYADILKRTKEYNKLERLEMSLAESTLRKRMITDEEREQAEKYLEKKKKYNATTAKRMAKFRAKKKLEEEERIRRGQRLTRSEEAKRKQKLAADAKRQRDKRAAMSEEELELIRANRRAKYQTKKNAEKQLQEMTEMKAREKELMEREKQLNDIKEKLDQREKELQSLESSLEAEDTRKPAARRKSLQRVRTSMPKKPSDYVTTCMDLFAKASPRKKDNFKKRGVGLQAAHTKVQNALSEGIAQVLGSVKSSRKKKDLEKKRHFAQIIGILKKYRLKVKAMKMFYIGRQGVKSANDNQRKVHGNSTPSHVVEIVTQFYEENAVVLPDKKFISKKTLKKTGFLQAPVSSLFSNFKAQHPSIKIGLKKFYQLRPKHIKLQQEIKYRGCLCEICTNIDLKATAINKTTNSYGLQSFFNGVYGVSRATLGPKEGKKYYNRRCIDRKCTSCGPDKLKTYLAKLTNLHGAGGKLITWKKWERETLQEGGKIISKQVLKTKTSSLEDCIDELIQESNRLSAHLHNATWQSHQFMDITNNLKDGWVVMVMDFAENLVCQYQDEIQSAHWYHSTCTIHPIVCYYKCGVPECSQVAQESLVFITADKNHDYHAVHDFMTRSVNHLKERMDVDTIIRFSDQCAAQYKSKGPFLDIANAETEYGVYVQHHYFGSRHGKGPSDGETAVVKRMASSAIKSGRAVINNAEDLFKFCSAEMTRGSDNQEECHHFRRKFFFIDAIDRERGHQNVDLRTVKGTRLLHSIKGHMEGRVYTRNLSCFCSGCTGMGVCQNKMYVDPWMTEVLVKQPTVTHVPAESTSQPPPVHEDQAIMCPPSVDKDQPACSALESNGQTDETTPELPPVHDQAFPMSPHSPEENQFTPKNSGQTTAQTAEIAEHDYVAVKVSGKKSSELHIAQVASLLEDGSCSLSYMNKSGRHYTWPQEEVYFVHPQTDIVAKLENPQPVLRGSRVVFNFDTSDAEKLFSKE